MVFPNFFANCWKPLTFDLHNAPMIPIQFSIEKMRTTPEVLNSIIISTSYDAHTKIKNIIVKSIGIYIYLY